MGDSLVHEIMFTDFCWMVVDVNCTIVAWWIIWQPKYSQMFPLLHFAPMNFNMHSIRCNNAYKVVLVILVVQIHRTIVTFTVLHLFNLFFNVQTTCQIHLVKLNLCKWFHHWRHRFASSREGIQFLGRLQSNMFSFVLQTLVAADYWEP